ncbi:hypothetical protein O4H31_16480 [Sulfitobacter dubius]|jgi:hypothetical protein|nr:MULTISPECIES: hypothetical protein [Sulfitobacter]MCZ4368292.1 hypothetical protein [Sulfitobacter dubius]|tara:strand:- start:867 stop:1193 length:327 start_codon:yes stop_codon:yes gene_type:complete
MDFHHRSLLKKWDKGLLHGLAQRTRLKPVDLGSPLPRNFQQSRPFEGVEMLRDSLTGQMSCAARLIRGDTQIEKRLTGLLQKRRQDAAPFGMRQRFEYKCYLILCHAC